MHSLHHGVAVIEPTATAPSQTNSVQITVLHTACPACTVILPLQRIRLQHISSSHQKRHARDGTTAALEEAIPVGHDTPQSHAHADAPNASTTPPPTCPSTPQPNRTRALFLIQKLCPEVTRWSTRTPTGTRDPPYHTTTTHAISAHALLLPYVSRQRPATPGLPLAPPHAIHHIEAAGLPTPVSSRG